MSVVMMKRSNCQKKKRLSLGRSPTDCVSNVVIGLAILWIAGLFWRRFANPSSSLLSLDGFMVSSTGNATVQVYQPAVAEDYLIKNLQQLNLHQPVPAKVRTCHLWKDPSSWPHQKRLIQYHQELETYFKKVDAFKLPERVVDLREHLDEGICQSVELEPTVFSSSQEQLSHVPGQGFVEPLLPPMRHPDFCFKGRSDVMNLRYMVHDFATLCRQLQPNSRTVFVDMGASLFFKKGHDTPMFWLVDLYKKFGIVFDHVYAYEQTPQDAGKVVENIPPHLQASYHWINVGVESNPNSKKNPFKLLLDHYKPTDFVVVKLDIDAPELERQLVNQLLESPKLQGLIDHFYFEHHVNIQEMAPHWKETSESVMQSFQLFSSLRQKGVAAHFWV